jgi:hypothetical protein
MISRRTWLVAVPVTALFAAAAVWARREGECCTTRHHAPQSPGAALDPLEPVDSAFAACALSCGSHEKIDPAEIRLQPGAAPGDAVTCPVSGAVFRVTSRSVRRQVRGMTLFFCCDACAAWFAEHEADVLAKRRIG